MTRGKMAGSLPTTKLGRTGWECTRIGFGGIPIGQIEDSEAAGRVLNHAIDCGINLVDTSYNYKLSQTHIGRHLSSRRSQYFLISKQGRTDAKGFWEELNRALVEMQTDCLDAYFLHSVSTREKWDAMMAPDGAYGALKDACERGLVRHTGISIHRDLDTMKTAIESGRFALILLVSSILDHEGTEPLLELAKEKNMGTLAMKALVGGQLVPEGGLLPPDIRYAVIRDCQRFVLSRDYVDCTLVGFKTVEEVNLGVEAALAPPITDNEIRTLRNRVGKIGKEFRYGQFCQRCGYCQPCPQGIRIPEIFQAASLHAAYPDKLKPMVLARYREASGNILDCTECRKCVDVCPSGILIPEKLKEIHEEFRTEHA